MQFEWHDEKNRINQQKHGLDFQAAIAVFDDPFRIEMDSTKPEYGEVRIKTIGKVEDTLIVAVVYTNRERRIRVISARKASKSERKVYEEYRNECNS